MSTDADVKAKEINVYWNGHTDATFEVVFYDGRVEYFDFRTEGILEPSSTYILIPREDAYYENVLLKVNTTYKTKPETNIPKCLQVLRRKFMHLRWDDPEYQKKF